MRRNEAAPPLKAVVIGSGIGGTAATMMLAHAGISTTLVEKNRRLGGSCAGYEKRGFSIDIGTHMFCRGHKGPLGEVLRRVGEGGALEFRRTDDIAEIRTVRGDRVLSVKVPSSRHRYPLFFLELAKVMELPPRELARAARMFTQILAMSDWEVEAYDDRTVEDFVMQYTDHPGLISVFGFLLGLYFILPYWQVSAGEAFWSFRKMVRDNHLSYPLGGSRAIPETYVRIAKKHGAEVRTGTGVRKILVRDNRVRGVELHDGTVISASHVVSTSSVRSTVKYLVGPEHFPESYVAMAERIQGSHIAVQAKIALDKKLVDAGALVGGVGQKVDLFGVTTSDLKAMFGCVLEGRIPPVVPFYCPVPTNFDPSLAPPGHQLLTVCAVAPTSNIALSDPGPAWEDAMLRTLSAVVPGLEEHTLFVDRFSVDFIEHWIGKEFGPAVSTGQMPGQVGPDRPPVTTPIEGLYLAGCGAGARGVGTELAAASAMECVDRIADELRHGRNAPRAAVRRSPSWSRAHLAYLASRALAKATRA